MLESIWFQAINVGALGAVNIGTITAPVAGQHFVCEGFGAMKGIGSWTAQPIIRVGTNPPAYNNIVSTAALTTISLRGINRTQTALLAIPSGTAIFVLVTTAGAVSSGTPLIDLYLAGSWLDITNV